jgi:transketolase
MKENIRIGYGDHIAELGNKNKDLIVLEGDLADSTLSETFQIAHPDRHFQIGIAEQNMVGIAAGLALEGKIPIVNSFAAFIAMRACEQVRTSVAYPNLNVKFIVSHAGLSAGSAGPTHHTLEDIAIMRAIPNMTVIVPGDVKEMKQALDQAIELKGPVYIRMSAADISPTYKEEVFRIGHATQLADGNDLTIITTGTLMNQGLEAVNILSQKHNVNARLLQFASVKPIDVEAIMHAVEDTRYILTIEEHNIIGGLGGAVSEIASEFGNLRLKRLGINDHFSGIGTPDYLLNEEGLNVENIIKEAISLISQV